MSLENQCFFGSPRLVKWSDILLLRSASHDGINRSPVDGTKVNTVEGLLTCKTTPTHG